MKILVTGGRGFIGSHLIKEICKQYAQHEIVNADGETYAARPPMYQKKPKNLKNIKIDIRDQLAVRRLLQQERPTHIIHMAAESHVCRSIAGPKDFIMTNIVGTWNLLEEFREVMHNGVPHRFLYVSTDEVFGVADRGAFNEKSPLKPRSPYAASKASGDLLVESYRETYGMDTIIVNCSNNFGPNQHEEKLIPKTIMNIYKRKPVEIYGPGTQVRDWIYVEDAATAILTAFKKGETGNRYCIGGEKELRNLDVVKTIYGLINELFPKHGYGLQLNHTNARPTDDKRYAIDNSKIKKLGWKPNPKSFDANLRYTILWYWEKMLVGSLGCASQGRE